MATAKRPNALVVFDPERRIEWVPDGVLALEKLGKVVVC
jgi:predicted transcriptional regulator